MLGYRLAAGVREAAPANGLNLLSILAMLPISRAWC